MRELGFVCETLSRHETKAMAATRRLSMRSDDDDSWLQGGGSNPGSPLSASRNFDPEFDIMDILDSRAPAFESPAKASLTRKSSAASMHRSASSSGREDTRSQQSSSPTFNDDDNDDDDGTSFNWSMSPPPRSVASETLYHDIQTAVDAVVDRLAQESPTPYDEVSPTHKTEVRAKDEAPEVADGNGDLLLIMEVVIGDGRTENIHIHRHDRADALATSFARTYGLGDGVIPTLIEHISQQVASMGLSLAPTTVTATPHPIVEDKEAQYLAMMDKYAALQRRSKDAPAVAATAFNQLKPSKLKASKTAKSTPAACERLHALARTRSEWRARELKRKEDDVTREIESRKLRLAEKSKALVANRTNGGHRSIGDRLHSEALSEAARRDKMAETRRREKEAQIDWMCPKCAHFNKFADKTCQNRTLKAGAATRKASSHKPKGVCGMAKPMLFTPTLLSTGPSKKAEDTEQLLVRRQKHQEMAQALYNTTHTFAPQLNPNSQDIVREKRGETHDAYAALYDDAATRRQKQTEKEAAYIASIPFKPDIGLHTQGGGDWVERLAVTDKTDAKRRDLLEKYGAANDPVTGRALFKPDIGRPPQFPRNDTKLPIGEFLYESRHEVRALRATLEAESDKRRKARQTQSFLSSTSKAMLEARKAKSYDVVYGLLQVACGQPSDAPVFDPAKLPIDALPPDLSHIALSLFDVCGFESIPKAEFYNRMETTLAQSPGLTHTQVLFFSDKPPAKPTAALAAAAEAKELTFRPKINPTSSTIERRQKDMSVFDALHQYQKTYEAKRKAKQAQMDEVLTKACPFTPTLVAKGSHLDNMYDNLPDDDSFDDDDAVILQTSKPLARPYVRPLDEEWPVEEPLLPVNRSPVGPTRPQLLMFGETPPLEKATVFEPRAFTLQQPNVEDHPADDEDVMNEENDDEEDVATEMAVHPIPSPARWAERVALLGPIPEEKLRKASPMQLLFGRPTKLPTDNDDDQGEEDGGDVGPMTTKDTSLRPPNELPLEATPPEASECF
ncbi:hypothetical protein SDRG_10080 [Saprolegnia diclina VS20]|uniref:Uncharacterized protein n=1 Tax=Saprolegnia diclina (strain VS20) TaxID=1156394 RepID=T0RIY4_SAPDV|nr:hypothetical protein SDRG_10080 [Saprolegnia diclina VS20]EQC32333.1 hypothetical protein SDRG_10080 [Saprolegnia diclina VS20]|eukprot:XP_008614274.1 hypothetical protein SDRG_10080 [Saprolegnia diclina VS20]